jgi:NADH-ubiquinone oxidoreductase chain 2
VLIISILLLLLASTSSLNRNASFLLDYVKLNRIVLLIFILSGYLAFNVLEVEALLNGIGIYGGVFKVTVLSQVLDIFLLFVGGIISILTCFVPYSIKNYDHSLNYERIENKLPKNYTFFRSKLRDYSYKRLRNYFPFKNSSLMTELIPSINIKTPYITENIRDYKKLEVKEYNLLLLYTVLGASLLLSANNLISLYLSLELQSFTLYLLSSSQIKSFKGTSGGLKYFLLGGLSSGFILLGCSLLYAYTGTLNLEYIFMIYSDNNTNISIDPCLLILFSGLLFKVSAAPFHH